MNRFLLCVVHLEAIRQPDSLHLNLMPLQSACASSDILSNILVSLLNMTKYDLEVLSISALSPVYNIIAWHLVYIKLCIYFNNQVCIYVYSSICVCLLCWRSLTIMAVELLSLCFLENCTSAFLCSHLHTALRMEGSCRKLTVQTLSVYMLLLQFLICSTLEKKMQAGNTWLIVVCVAKNTYSRPMCLQADDPLVTT